MRTLLYLTLLAFGVIGCTAKNKIVPTEPLAGVYDHRLADSLGADQRGMKNYMLVLLKTGPKDSVITDTQKRAEIFKGHFAHMEKMQKEGKLIMAGPFATKNHLAYRGLFLLQAASPEEARAIVQGDPSIASEIFSVEILPFYGSAALPMHLKYHQRISKQD